MSSSVPRRRLDVEQYQDRYEHARLARGDNGVLEVALHTGGGPLVWSESVHRELPQLFADVGGDPQNRVVILTGTGDVFCRDAVFDVWDDMDPSARWDKLYVEGKRLLENLLNIEVPVIAAANGPAGIHAELLVLADIVLAAESASFSDSHVRLDMVAGDGVHVVWPLVLGPNRGRYFLLTGEEINASQALQLGVVQEIMPGERLLPRARELGGELAGKSLLTLRGTRAALTQRLKRHLLDGLGYGLVFEGRAATAGALGTTADWTGREHLI